MNATRKQIEAQYKRAKANGWIKHFIDAENTFTKDYFDAADLMGIGSRETNLDPKWLTKPGDGGHGYGLMQADNRSFPGWIETGEWKNARSGILKGAQILMMKWKDMESIAGKRVTVKGKTFTGPRLSGFKAQQAVISSYNCGRWALYAAATGKDVDTYSTGKDYSSDVIERAAIFRELLQNDSTADQPATDGPTTKNSIQSQSANLTDGQSSNTPASLIPVPTPVVEVETVSAAPTEPKPDPSESALAKIGNKANAAYTTFGALISGIIAWFSGAAPAIVFAVMGAAVILGLSYMVINAVRASQKDKRDRADRLELEKIAADEREKREQRAHEIQMLTLKAAADPSLQTVRLVPPPPTTEVPNSDSPEAQ